VRAGLLLAGLTWEIGYPIFYDEFLRLGAAGLAGLGAELKQYFGAPCIAFQCAIHQLLEQQLKPRCSLRTTAFAVCGEDISELADDVDDELVLSIVSASSTERRDDRPPGLALCPFFHWVALGGRPRPIS
jgi:hypothetical protein